jgi:hypothetical protein
VPVVTDPATPSPAADLVAVEPAADPATPVTSADTPATPSGESAAVLPAAQAQ